MATFKLDKTLESDGIYQYTTDNKVKYAVRISESSPGSGLASLDFMLVSGNPSSSEIFKTIGTLYQLATEYVEKKKLKHILLTIDGPNRTEIDQKTKIFTRWIDTDIWDYQITSNPEILIPGKRNGSIILQTNSISMKRKEDVATKQSKFCGNCGNSIIIGNKFCGNCGNSLQEG